MNPMVGQLLKAARERKGLKQGEMGKLMGVKGATVSSWELNKSAPDVDDIVAFCRICGTDYEDLLRKVYGDPTNPMQDFKCTPEEMEMIRKYRKLDARGQMVVSRNLLAEYELATATADVKE